MIMRIREPKTTALVFASGKMVCTGAKCEHDSKVAARKFAKIVKKIGKMTKYETKSYVGRQKILDLDAASDEATSDVGGVSEEI